MFKKALSILLAMLILLTVYTSIPISALNGHPCEQEAWVDPEIEWGDYAVTSADKQYQYINNDDGTITFYNYLNDEEEELSIPAEIDGKKVASIRSFDVDTSEFDIFGPKAESGTVKSLVIPEGVVRIEKWGLCSRTLERVVLPDSMKDIGERAFYNCESLNYVKLGNGIKEFDSGMFEGCEKLEDITLPKSISKLIKVPLKPYISCNTLKNIYVDPDNPYFSSDGGVVYSKDKKTLAFYPKNHGASYDVASGTEKIDNEAFYASAISSLNLPQSLISIGNSAFSLSTLSALNISSNVKYIGSKIVFGCSYISAFSVSADNNYFSARDGVLFNKNKTTLLSYPVNKETESYSIPEGTVTVGAFAFYDAFRIKKVSMPDSLEKIDKYAFATCQYLSEVNLNKGLKEIGSFAFEYTRELKGIILPNTLKTISYAAFYWSEIREIIIPESVTTLYPSAFEASSVERVEIRAELAAIGTETFSICNKLKEVVLPDSLEYIGPYAFYYNFSLEKLSIPDSVTEIDPCAFTGTSVTLEGSKDSYAQQFASDYDLKFSVKEKISEKRSILEANAELSSVSYVYDGSAKKPVPKVTFKGTVLKEGQDYTVSYKNNVNAGKATAVIKGIGNYTDTLTLEFAISQKGVNNLKYSLGTYDSTYSGTAKRPTVTVTDGSTKLSDGKDYAVTYSNNINAGQATAKVVFIGNYAGTYTLPFNINPKSIGSLNLNVSSQKYTYDGVEKRPSVELKDGSKVLTDNLDYTVSYSNNINAGTASVKVKGAGNYIGSVTRTFTISKQSINNAKVTLESDRYYYDGSEKRPSVTVELNGKELTAQTDYTVEYKNNKEVGNASVIVKGAGNYDGSASADFTIQQNIKDIASLDITVGGSSYYSTDYTGKAITPKVSIKDGAKVLVENTDYTVKYATNVNAGKATITISGKGSYSGTLKKSFTINRIASSDIETKVNTTSYNYDGNEKRPTVTSTWNGFTLKSGLDYDIVSYENNINAGTGKINIEFKGNFKGKISKTFVINGKPITDAEIKLDTTYFYYDGTEKKPVASVYLDNKLLIANTDYTCSYIDNVNAGTAYAIIKPTGNYNGATMGKSFTIGKRNISQAQISLSPGSFSYDGKAKTPTVSITYGGKKLVQNTDYTVSYSNNTSPGTAKVTITGKGNFSRTVEQSFYISGSSISSAVVTLDKTVYSYTGSAIKPGVTITLNSNKLKENTDYTVSYSNNVNVGTATVTITGKGKYVGTISKNFTIKSDKFDFEWASSNWSFTNSVSNFFADGKYHPHLDLLKQEYLNKLKSILSGSLYSRWSDYYTIFSTEDNNNDGKPDGWAMHNWGGSCYGMSALVVLAAAGIVPYDEYTSGADSLYEMDRPKNNADVASLITYYYLLQIKMSDHKYTVMQRTHEANIKNIIANIKNYGMTMVDFRWTGDDGYSHGHSTVGYDYKYESGTTKNGFKYDGYICLCDPNYQTAKTETRVYFNTKDNYSWSIPAYSNCKSSSGAVFNVICADISLINYDGYLNGNYSDDYNDYSYSNAASRLNTFTLSETATVEKAYENNGAYFSAVANSADIVREDSYTVAENDGDAGYTLRDIESPYIISQAEPEPVNLSYNSLNGIYSASAPLAKSVVFDDSNNLVRINGNDTPFTLTMVSNNNPATSWFNVSVSGEKANTITLQKTDEGYIVSSDNLKDITVNAENINNSAQTVFSTAYDKALIYEINPTTIGVKVDADDDGEFETDIVENNLKSISDYTIDLEQESFVYSGEKITPKLTVEGEDGFLEENKDYTVSYYNNDEEGTAVAVVTGTGKYRGVVSKDFIIESMPEKGILGDVDGNGVVNILDVTYIQKWIAKINLSATFNKEAADVNEDGVINIKDATFIQKWLVKLPSNYKIGNPIS